MIYIFLAICIIATIYDMMMGKNHLLGMGFMNLPKQ